MSFRSWVQLPIPDMSPLRAVASSVLCAFLFNGCTSPGGSRPTTTPTTTPITTAQRSSTTSNATPAQWAARATVPVLCYHQIRDWRPGESEYSRGLTTPPALFEQQMALLAGDGWTPISMRAYLDHIERNTVLPPKPVLLTFDDGHISQITSGLPILRKYGFTATFFLMTVVIGKGNWIKSDDIRRLDTEGFTIAAHTYDHQNLAKLPAADFPRQVADSRRRLEAIVGHPITFFAYPFGAWNVAALSRIVPLGFEAAFQLSDHKMDPTWPMLTLRRQIANPLTGIDGFRRQVSASVNTSTVQR